MFTITIETLSPKLASRLKRDIEGLLHDYENTAKDRDDRRAAQYAVNHVELRRVK